MTPDPTQAQADQLRQEGQLTLELSSSSTSVDRGALSHTNPCTVPKKEKGDAEPSTPKRPAPRAKLERLKAEPHTNLTKGERDVSAGKKRQSAHMTPMTIKKERIDSGGLVVDGSGDYRGACP